MYEEILGELELRRRQAQELFNVNAGMYFDPSRFVIEHIPSSGTDLITVVNPLMLKWGSCHPTSSHHKGVAGQRGMTMSRRRD